MRVGIYGKARQPDLAAVAAGFRSLGHAAEFHDAGHFDPAADVREFDAVVTLGQRFHGKRVADAYRGVGVPVWTVDLPPLRWPHLEDHRALWSEKINRLPASAPADRFESFGIQLQPKRRSGHIALICGQVGNDAAHGLTAADMRRWAERAADRARRFGLTPVWRPHPRDDFAIPGISRSTIPLEADLARPLRVVVTHNSTAGLRAIAAGVPVVCSGASFYGELAGAFDSDWRSPRWTTLDQRRAFYARGAYTQWTIQELSQGYALSQSEKLWRRSRRAA